MTGYSWTCAKTNLPILAAEIGYRGHEASHVVLLDDEGNRWSGQYDGFGSIGPLEFADTPLYDKLMDGRAKMVIRKFFDPKSDTFESLGRSRDEPGQGWNHDPDFLDAAFAAGGFRCHQGYLLAYHQRLDVATASRMDAADAKALASFLAETAKALNELRRGGAGVPEGERFRAVYNVQTEQDADGLLSFQGMPEPILVSYGVVSYGGVAYPSPAEAAVVAAAELAAAFPVEERAEVALVSPDGDAGTIRIMGSALGDHYYVAEATDGVPGVHSYPHGALKACGVEQTDAIFNAVYHAGDDGWRRVEVEVPAPSRGMRP